MAKLTDITVHISFAKRPRKDKVIVLLINSSYIISLDKKPVWSNTKKVVTT